MLNGVWTASMETCLITYKALKTVNDANDDDPLVECGAIQSQYHHHYF